MKNCYWGIIPILFMLFSCNDDDIQQPTASVNDFAALTVGNYWIYEHFKIDTFGVETSLSKFDSIVVEKDTLINGNVYYQLGGLSLLKGNQRNWEPNNIFRDSAGFLVNARGDIVLAVNNFSDVLSEVIIAIDVDTFMEASYKMEPVTGVVSVPAGSFDDVLNLKGEVYRNNPLKEPGNPRIENHFYARDVGKILETYYWYSQFGRFERRLIRYKVQ